MTSLELFAAYWKDNEFTGYYDFPGDYEQVAEDAWQASRRAALEDALGNTTIIGLEGARFTVVYADTIRALLEAE
ncbi:MAG: hypothetical protein GY944_04585 [bacterium]|nr:hypothetical protein [bacterium]